MIGGPSIQEVKAKTARVPARGDWRKIRSALKSNPLIANIYPKTRAAVDINIPIEAIGSH